jgi:hypothetical protein
MTERPPVGRPLLSQRLLVFVGTLLYSAWFLGCARVVYASRGTCAGRAGIAAGRRRSAGTRGALPHCAVLHHALRCAWSDVARTRRAVVIGLSGGLREGGRRRKRKDTGGCQNDLLHLLPP